MTRTMRVNTDRIPCWGVEVGVGSAVVRPIGVIRGSPTGVRTSSTRRRKLASDQQPASGCDIHLQLRRPWVPPFSGDRG